MGGEDDRAGTDVPQARLDPAIAVDVEHRASRGHRYALGPEQTSQTEAVTARVEHALIRQLDRGRHLEREADLSRLEADIESRLFGCSYLSLDHLDLGGIGGVCVSGRCGPIALHLGGETRHLTHRPLVGGGVRLGHVGTELVPQPVISSTMKRGDLGSRVPGGSPCHQIPLHQGNREPVICKPQRRG